MNYFRKRINATPFFLLNSYVFLWSLINFDSIYPHNEALIMTILFIVILFSQFIFCFLLGKFGFPLSIFFSCGNLVYFNLILNGQSNSLNIVYIFLFLILFLFLNFVSKINVFIYFGILFLFTFISNTYKIFKYNNDKTVISNKSFINIRNNKKFNFYFIGIDGMISNEMYNNFFLGDSPSLKTLNQLGFLVFDNYSPGHGTLETYAKLFSYKRDIHTRDALKLINSSSSSFFLDSKYLGYKKQFSFYTNYFGGDPNDIFDSYYPKINKPFSFVLYTDERWGWYSAYLIKNLLKFDSDNYSNQSEIICDRINSIDIINYKWISISHLWFPGHTLGSYNFNNLSDFNNFKSYYINSQRELSSFFKKITNIILKKDKNAVIVFFGDHGAYMLKGAVSDSYSYGFKVSNELILKDKRHVSVAVFPNDFLDSVDVNFLRLNPQYLFKIVINKKH